MISISFLRTRHHALLLGSLLFTAVGCDDEEKDAASPVAQVVAKLRSCDVITEGEARIGLEDRELTPQIRCDLECIRDASSCADVSMWFCTSRPSGALDVCMDACERSHGFECAPGVVIPDYWRCNGSDDCDDGSDEAGCQGMVTSCGSGDEAISSSRVCDGLADCTEGSDEIGCDVPTFACGAYEQTVPATWECDFDADCDDGSDEAEHCAKRNCAGG